MMKLEQIRDSETLRQVAILLENSVAKLQKENTKLRCEIARLRGQAVDPQMELGLLKEQLAAMQSKLFAASSEKRPSENTEETTAVPKTPKTGHGPKPQPNLPVEVVTHTVAEEEKTCTFCGGHLEEWEGQAEESEEITVVGIEYKVLKHRRQKYRCSCETQVVTAPGPVKLIPGGRYSIDFAVHVAENKYLDHLPLERQVRAMARAGLDTDSQTLWDQIDALARHLEPSYRALCTEVRKAGVVYADETRWQLATRQGTARWWTWCLASDETATYTIVSSRSAKAARQVLEGFEGVVMTDGYGAYQSLEKSSRAGPGNPIVLAHCWAHVRRKYLEAENMSPDLSKKALDLIGKLYAVERRVPKITRTMSPAEREERLALRRKLRHEQSRPVIFELRDWALEHRGSVLPRSAIGKAIGYMLNLWEGLTVFLDDPRVPLDNNAAERALRGVVVGRKNHYGSRSKRGTEVAAIFYTLLESAKLAGVNPREYLREAAIRAIKNPGTATLPSALA
jgi:transposase